MAKLIFGMMQSLDGYIAGAPGGPDLPPPGIALHYHFNDHVRGLGGMLYGRRIYEVMRYWDEAGPDWEAVEHDFAAAWRPKPKWVVSRTLKSVGPNATIVSDSIEAFVRRLKETVEGDIDIAGPELAGFLTGLGLIDEYHLYFRPFVLGGGKPFFAGARPPLRLIASDEIGENTVRLKYVPVVAEPRLSEERDKHNLSSPASIDAIASMRGKGPNLANRREPPKLGSLPLAQLRCARPGMTWVCEGGDARVSQV